ncbi:MAG: VOC family protein [Myxococcota bacterium]
MTGSPWVGIDGYTRDIPRIQAFYRRVLGPIADGIVFRPCDPGLAPPRWVGFVGGVDRQALGDTLIDHGGVELAADGSRRIWLDPWGAILGGADARPAIDAPTVQLELAARDVPRALGFYREWLGASVRDGCLWLGDGLLGRVRAAAPTEAAEWHAWFSVPDPAAACDRALADGARRLADPDGRIWLTDPAGCPFGLAAGSTAPVGGGS